MIILKVHVTRIVLKVPFNPNQTIGVLYVGVLAYNWIYSSVL